MPQEGDVLQQFAGDKDNRGRKQSGQKLSRHQNFAPNGCQKIEVKASVENLASKQVHENSETAEEHSQAQKEKLEDTGEHHGVAVRGCSLPECECCPPCRR